ncbi:amino acid ABC transporter permease [Azospirillum canadense]|uniref:amino acid ABC transporter permease n=1 Tax=Azospirillum canadense TaxID=403962 RepID=UPI0022278EE1|nr:ABC transporter permease subunit [Azospirillum canadense]MCW2238422.1 general L-amino acid transport system permease protein [Azospirillum canadense]
MTNDRSVPEGPPRGPAWTAARIRGLAIQGAILAALVGLLAWGVGNAIHNLNKAGIAAGFHFLGNRAGFDINFRLIDYSPAATYGRAFVVGVLNTLTVSALGIVAATALGFALGIGRLSRNWLVSRTAATVIETVRNLPLLLQLLFWYTAVLAPLPRPRNAISLGGLAFLSNRGLTVPGPVSDGPVWMVWAALGLGLAAAAAIGIWSRRRRIQTGQRFPAGWVGLALIVLPPLAVLGSGTVPLSWDIPVLKGFNFDGGLTLVPELIALWLALTLYSGAFIGETVRAGILSVPKGQVEAAQAMGLTPGAVLRLVVVPQAMRVIIPPMTTQHLTLLKNSSLAVVIGFPDLVAVFSGTTLNQTGQAIETIGMTMAVYLVVSLAISFGMNLYNSKMAIVRR